jgi:4-hydroxybenzoate polyprenyltransferase
MRAWGRLLRLSLAPTAAADIAAGVVLGGGGFDRKVALVVLGSLCVYHGGMALNDWADRAADAQLRPDRPIPSGRVAAPAALAVAVLLLAGGPALASLASPRSAAALGAVAVMAAAYDLGVRGPTLLALCRGGNLLAGILVGSADPRPMLLPVFAYAGYVAAVSALARLEDAPLDVIARAHPARSLRLAALLLLLAPITAFHGGFPGLGAGLVIAALGASTLAAAARRRAAWTQAEICRAVGLGLRRLLVFTSAVAVARGTLEGTIVAGAILCGYPIAYALRAVFPPS